MKKKILIVLTAVLLLIPASVFAGDLFGLQLGVSATYLQSVELNEDFAIDPTDLTVDDFLIGGDIRFNVSLFEVSSLILPIEYGEYEDDYYMYAYVFPGAGVSLELLGLVDVAVTVGPAFTVAASTGGLFYSDIEYYGYENLPLWGRLSADVNLGPVSVGAYFLTDTTLRLGQILDPSFDPGELQIPSTGLLGLSATVNLL